MGVADYGHGAPMDHGQHHGDHHAPPSEAGEGAPAQGADGAVPVTEFTEMDPAEPADVAITLVARAEQVELPDGSTFQGYTLNGTTPGPTVRAQAGEVGEVT